MTVQFDYGLFDANIARSHSAGEREQIFDLWCEIGKLDRHAQKFDCILKLYRFARDESRSRTSTASALRDEFAKTGRDAPEGRALLAKCQALESDLMMYLSWAHTAARDGAMTIYHLCQGMELIWSRLQRCGLFDPGKVANAKELAKSHFERSFPAFVAINESAIALANGRSSSHPDGHPIEPAHFNSAVGLSLFFGGALEGDTFQVTYGNHIHGYDLYENSLAALQQSIDLIRTSLVRDARSNRRVHR